MQGRGRERRARCRLSKAGEHRQQTEGAGTLPLGGQSKGGTGGESEEVQGEKKQKEPREGGKEKRVTRRLIFECFLSAWHWVDSTLLLL